MLQRDVWKKVLGAFEVLGRTELEESLVSILKICFTMVTWIRQSTATSKYVISQICFQEYCHLNLYFRVVATSSLICTLYLRHVESHKLICV